LLIDASEPWPSGLLANEGYFGWLVEHEDLVVAGGGILLRELPPTPGCLRLGRWAHVVNVYTEPGHRRRGLARSLMNVLLDWCAANAIDQVTLAASDEGRPLYESIGFTATADMKLRR
jgi:GNAT superfamily N-acetyltransferase